MSGFVLVSRYTIKMTISNQDILQTLMKNKTNCKPRITRHRFIGAAASMTVFTIVPRHVLSGHGKMPPSEKLNIACIGIGGKGFDNVRCPQMPRKPSHTDDWVEACKTNDPTRPGTNFGYAGPLTETVLLGIAAYRAGEKLSWDAENLKITNNPQAECFIRRENYRKGWEI
jgi:hypothetical protein